MSPKNILQTLKSSLERESEFQDKPISMNLEYCETFAKGTIMEFIEGRWVAFEVLARPVGISDPLRISDLAG